MTPGPMFHFCMSMYFLTMKMFWYYSLISSHIHPSLAFHVEFFCFQKQFNDHNFNFCQLFSKSFFCQVCCVYIHGFSLQMYPLLPWWCFVNRCCISELFHCAVLVTMVTSETMNYYITPITLYNICNKK